MLRLIVTVSSLVLVFSGAQAREKALPPLDVVSEVDLQRYVGTWYEIARLPNWFQKQCTGDVTATYTLLNDGAIKVVNSCRKRTGSWHKQRDGQSWPIRMGRTPSLRYDLRQSCSRFFRSCGGTIGSSSLPLTTATP